jgi:hypothetical protein
MHAHRFQQHLPTYRLPRPVEPRISAAHFLICPLAGFQEWSPVQAWIYQQAFEQAKAVAAPSLPERDLLAVWN